MNEKYWGEKKPPAKKGAQPMVVNQKNI